MSKSSTVYAKAEIVPLYRTKESLSSNWRAVDPTTATYAHLRHAYGFLSLLFSDPLPPCLITFQRKTGSMGYFSHKKFTSYDGVIFADEIALNPLHFALGDKETLSTLVHEMVHLWQHHFGTVSGDCYHNEQWAQKMLSIGLIPSHTGKVGGRQMGQRMSHYIDPGGRFDQAANELIAKGFVVAYVEQLTPEQKVLKLKKNASKTRFSCRCGQRIWGKPGTAATCSRCKQPFV
ncbi:MAG: SprT-like domain-containing protein [Pseudomonadota bacterium]